jgi:peptide-methionine (S)-S-oxide reductase
MAFYFKLLVFAFFTVACTSKNITQANMDTPSRLSRDVPSSVSKPRKGSIDTSKLETATLAAGCFWKMDAAYQQLRGVEHVEVGFAGGKLKNPTYEQVCTRTTGHAETVQVVFDPKVVSFREILEVFWTIHDPTVLNQEGNDKGDDYRSVVFYRSEDQKTMAKTVKDSLDKVHLHPQPIVTTIEPYTHFYRAETYHQNYYNLHPDEPYTYNVVRKKVELFEKVFAAKRKK